MFDYKVNYENHTSFTDTGNRKRKFGSPVRIFTNVALSRLNLTGIEGYKFCTSCGYWVSNENKHCNECNACTSKDGRTYIHCEKCSKCVKPTYQHCEQCERCCLPNHVCGEFMPDLTCYHCGKPGHKKNSCPELLKMKEVDSDNKMHRKRKRIK
ncbi:hypothetical protein RUM44_001797 [Polyplax serrata]|uniref:CCHC-type domain-containing protein n=1 Tax=Polyplax serrata TaxID=468196 RepID=A0ABR1AL33_POLSC